MEAITDQVRKPRVSSKDLIDVRTRHQFLPLEWANLRPFQTRLEYGKKGVASLPMLNMTGESFLLGNCLCHVQIIENRMIFIMDGKEKPDNQEKVWRMKSTIARTGAGQDRGGDSPGED